MEAKFMEIALECAKKVKGKTAPNPAVGAIIVKDEQIIGKGATGAVGENHAEINALLGAGELSDGADLYVSLEPCSHYGKTPPCTDAIIKAGIKRVFIACLDPNPQVAGRGTEKLRAAGIEVETGILADEATRLNEDFFWYITRKKPFVAAKLALTLDNKIADDFGNSQWITCEKSRQHTHFLRSIYSSIAVGNGTLSADNPQLTVRGIEGAKDPVRIVFASDKNAGQGSFFRQNAKNHRSILVLRGIDKYREIDKDGVEIWATGESDYKDVFLSFLEIAGSEEIDSVLLEGGSKLIANALEARAINRLFLFYATKILGGNAHGLQLNSPLQLSAPITLEKTETQTLGSDILLSGLVRYS